MKKSSQHSMPDMQAVHKFILFLLLKTFLITTSKMKMKVMHIMDQSHYGGA